MKRIVQIGLLLLLPVSSLPTFTGICRADGGLGTRMEAYLEKEIRAMKKRKYLLLPLEYDGRPHESVPGKDREKIVRIHGRYWKNCSKIKKLSFKYSRHTYVDGRPDPDLLDMDAIVEIKGTHMRINGRDGSGRDFMVEVDEYGQTSTTIYRRQWASLLREFRLINNAHPDRCSIFTGIHEDIRGKNGNTRYDVLVGIKKRPEPDKENHEYSEKFWFNRETGMPERVIFGKSQAKEKFIRYRTVEIKYGKVDGLYYPAERIDRLSGKKQKIVEEFFNVRLN